MKEGIKFGIDGNQVTAVWNDFEEMQGCKIGFGCNVGEAILDLLLNSPKEAKEYK